MSENSVEELKNLGNIVKKIKDEIHKFIVGQDQVIEQFLIAIFSNGHCIIEGVPGLAKTKLISSMAKVFELNFRRIQFTPDLMPADITGTEVLVENTTTGEKEFKFIKGPLFANIILADEINRTPPKTQAALLQAMQENEITVGNETLKLDSPFFVFATQNPIEQEGTYPLPEAQLDRFMFKININYPSFDEEKQIIMLTTTPKDDKIKSIISKDNIIKFQNIIKEMPVSEHVIDFAVKLARSTRPKSPDAHELTKKWITWGAGPRASQFLIIGAKTKAALEGRFSPSENDIIQIAPIILQHRILISFAAEAEGLTPTSIIKQICENQ